MKPYDVVAIGDANIDMVIVGCKELPLPGQEVFVDGMLITVGGGAALFTLALAKLGMKLAFHGVLGKDYYGTYILDTFSQNAVDTSFMKLSDRSNTGISIAINSDDDRSFITSLGSNAELSLTQLDADSVELGRHVHLTGYKGSRNHGEFIAAVRQIKASGATVSCDVGWDDTGEWYAGVFDLMREVDVFFLNETEALHYTRTSVMEEAVARLLETEAHVVIKMGEAGAMALCGGKTVFRSGYRVDAVDTTGAGDSFNAGYIYGFLSDRETAHCLAYGNACGAFSVTAYGGHTAIPGIDVLEQFIAERATEIKESGEAIR